MSDPTYLRGLQEEDHGGIASGIIFFGALTACFLWCCGPSILGCLKKCCLQMPRNRNRNQQSHDDQEVENAINSMIQSAEDADRARNALISILGGTASQRGNLHNTRAGQRKEHIDRVLKTKVYTTEKDFDSKEINETADTDAKASEVGCNEKDGSKEEEGKEGGHVNEDVEQQKQKAKDESELDSQADQDEGCIICLNSYVEGEEIASSQNEECAHVFHRSCITEWLMKREDCPICRTRFICLEDYPGLHPPEYYSEDFLGEDSEHLPIQLLRGLEILYRARAISATPRQLENLSSIQSSNETEMTSTQRESARAEGASTVDNRQEHVTASPSQLETDRVNDSEEQVEPAPIQAEDDSMPNEDLYPTLGLGSDREIPQRASSS